MRCEVNQKTCFLSFWVEPTLYNYHSDDDNNNNRNTHRNWLHLRKLGPSRKIRETLLDRKWRTKIFLSLRGLWSVFNSQLTVWLQAKWALRCKGSSQESLFHDLFGWGTLLTHNQHLCAYKYTHARDTPILQACAHTHMHKQYDARMGTSYLQNKKYTVSALYE